MTVAAVIGKELARGVLIGGRAPGRIIDSEVIMDGCQAIPAGPAPSSCIRTRPPDHPAAVRALIRTYTCRPRWPPSSPDATRARATRPSIGGQRTIRRRARSSDGASAQWRAPFRHRGKRPGTTINTATSTADSTTTSHDAKFDAATVRSLIRVRELGPDDGDVVDVVFAGLSPHSRYLRFQVPVAELSAATRRSLTALDGRTPVALAAFAQGCPIGIVRIIDLGDGRGELAVEVVDRWQGCGVGTQLLQAARDRAADMGYRELIGEMLVVNAAAQATLRRVFLVPRVCRDGSELTITMPVDGGTAPASSVEGLVA
jgi:GNAT superfamily N-acetyltransferase